MLTRQTRDQTWKWLSLLFVGMALSRPAETTHAQGIPPDVAANADYVRLADSSVASRLQLTAQQRQQIETLLNERSDALTAAADEQKPAVIAEFDQKLGAVLTDNQRVAFAKLESQPKLRFNFRFQKWTDVLEWFAEQADLSLVLDAPPPGTFNYTDNREYTPAEAIDLLNGVLQTKGFTLIRRERMLLAVSLKEGIPEGLIPRIDLSELDERGRFELVSVLFPLGRRSAEEVNNEIKSLLSQHGKSVPLPKTKQLLVTDMAGIMRAVGAIIESIPEPAEQKQDKPKEPEKPTLVVYPVKSVDPAAAVEALQALMPEAKFVYDGKALQISAYATPTQQAAVEKVLQQMQANNPPEKQPRLEVYPVAAGSGEELLANLRMIVPGAQLRLDPLGDRLIAWSTPGEHLKLKDGIEALQQAGSPQSTRQVETYGLTKVDPNTTLSLLQTLVPRARLSVDAKTQRLVAVAAPDDQRIIRSTLEQLQPEKDGPDTPELRIYALEKPPAAGLVGVLNALVPKAQITPDDNPTRLIVVASPLDHDVVRSTIERMAESTASNAKHTLEIYAVTPAERRRFDALIGSLQSELPGMQVIADARPGELAVWATPAQHDVVRDVVEKLKSPASPAAPYELVAYSIATADPNSALTVLQNLFPDTKIVLDAKTRRLLVWTRPDEHKSVKQAVEQINAGQPVQTEEKFRAFPLSEADPDAAVTMLQQVFPEMRFSTDRIAGTVMAWGRESELDKVARTIEKMQVRQNPELKPRVAVYEVNDREVASLIPMLRQLVPAARIDAHPRSGAIVAWATPEDHNSIRSTIDQLQLQTKIGGDVKLEIYPLKNVDSTAALNMLRELFRNDSSLVQLSLDPNGGRLAALAAPEHHAIIRAAVERLQTEEPKLEVFQLEAVDTSSAALAIDRLFGSNGPQGTGGRPAVDADPVAQQLYVRGSGEAIDRVRDLLIKMGETSLAASPSIGVNRGRIRVIPFRGDTQAAVDQLRQVWPQLRRNSIRVVTPSALAPALRRGGDTTGIKPTDAESERQTDDLAPTAQDSAPAAEEDAHPEKPAGDAQYSVDDNREDVPNRPEAFEPDDRSRPSTTATTQSPPEPGSSQREQPLPAVVVAPGDGRITIASDDLEALDQMEALLKGMTGRPASRGHDFAVFALRNSSADQIAGTLRQLVGSTAFSLRSSGGVTIVPDSRLNAIVVHANRNDRDTVEDLLSVLDTADVPESLTANKPRVIPLKYAQASRVEPVIRDVYQSQLTRGGGQTPLPVPSGVSRQVAAAIQQYNAAVSGPLLTISVDEQTNSLVVLAPLTLADEIADLVGELDRSAAEGLSRGLKLIPLKSTNSDHVRQALDEIFNTGTGRRRRSR